MLERLKELSDVTKRYELAKTLLCEVVERTQNFREGYFALRMLDELQGYVFPVDENATPNSVLEQRILHTHNMIATAMAHAERIDR